MMKFFGTYPELQERVRRTKIPGAWRDIGNQKQYRAGAGAILNWWESTKTIAFQGSGAAAKEVAVAFGREASAGEAALAEQAPKASPLQQLHDENAELKKLIGEVMLENAVLKKRGSDG